MQRAALTAGDAIAEGEGLAGGGAAVALFAGELAHARIEEPCALRAGRVLVAGVGGGEVAIGEAFGEDRFSLLAVESEALGLLVLFVPIEAEPLRPSKMDCTLASVLRSTSVSSRRSTMVPPLWRAKSQLKMKVRALPTWRKPVGEGAKRTRRAFD